MAIHIVSQIPIVTKTNLDKVVTLDHIIVTGATAPLTFDTGATSNCLVSFDSGIDNEFIVTPTAEFYGLATVLIRVNDGSSVSEWFLLQIGVIADFIAGGGFPITQTGSYALEGPNRVIRRIKKDYIISKNPRSLREGDPFYSTGYPLTQ